ncbi:alpha-amylase family glycosyl hydrolase [Corynebacterium felinum]|nr:alpha-amylase family glycosyl hydrolase [Corynebacterium felinum]
MTQSHSMKTPEWLNTAVFYQIYPQSFYDSNGDGIGDLNGITEKLDHLTYLGINAIWLNPIYHSPFKDAGYDITDHTRIAARYGTETDLTTLIDACHQRNIKITLDLVPGHTSEQHPWFIHSTTNPDCDRYIWTDHWFGDADGLPYIAGETPRNGNYIINFFKCQPALNYGFGRRRHAWQKPSTSQGAETNRQAIADIMKHWLDKGIDGFRVDMADSLVKHDPDKKETIRTWHNIFNRIRPHHPNAAYIAEWGNPAQSLKAGFHTDFYLDWPGNGYNLLVRDKHPYFAPNSPHTTQDFINLYLPHYNATRDKGHFSLISGNHDTTRLAHHLDETSQHLYYTFQLTMPGVPFIYYGDEIAMTWHNLPTHEGGYTRTGSRTPMQWTTNTNAGFSTNPNTYLPTYTNTNVETHRNNPHSLLNHIRTLIHHRHTQPGLHAHQPLTFIPTPNPRIMAYRRGEGIEVYINVSTQNTTLPSGGTTLIHTYGGATLTDNQLTLPPMSAAILKPTQESYPHK